MTMIYATPSSAPIPVADFLRPSTKDQATIAKMNCPTGNGLCSVPIHIAIFFDGTNNNLYRDREGVRVGVPDARGKPTPISKKPVPPESADHSNIARLFRAFPSTKMGEGKLSFYIPGPGTPFPEIGEHTETQEGKRLLRVGSRE